MRKLRLSDAGKASKILKKMELRVDGKVEGADVETLGASLMLKLMENYHVAEREVAEFMASLIEDGMTAEKFLNLGLDEVMPYFEELKNDEGLKSFLLHLSRLMKQN